jgi:hypothetical protein
MSQSIEETNKTIISPNIQLQEEKRTKEVVRIELKERDENFEKMKYEIVSLRKELEKTTAQLNRSLKFGKCIEILDDIIKFQISPLIKTGLGYDKS